MPAVRNIMVAILATGLVGAVGPATAQYQQPPTRGAFAHACFPADQTAAYLRVEWPQSGRWAVYNQPFGSNIRVYIGPEPAQWCFSVRLNEVMRPCRPAFTQPVQPGC